MANSWQEAHNRRNAAQQIQTAQQVYGTMIESMRQEVVNLKNQVIESFVKEELGTEILLDMTQITARSYVGQAEDGSEVFHWDNLPRIYFAPIDMQVVDGVARPVLKWQRIPLPSMEEPDLSKFTQADEEFARYLTMAKERNWNRPVSDLIDPAEWLALWKECEATESQEA